MTYGQIISILFVALLCYYAFLIVMDIQRAKAAEAAEQDNHVEEDIDISDEAQSFRPHKVSREEPKKEEEKKEDSHNENASESCLQDDASPTQSDADTSQKGKEEFEDENGKVIFCFDIISEVELKPEIIDAQQKEILPLVEKYKGIYDGWGTYFEDPNAEDDEYGDDGEFFDDEDVEDDNERLH